MTKGVQNHSSKNEDLQSHNTKQDQNLMCGDHNTKYQFPPTRNQVLGLSTERI